MSTQEEPAKKTPPDYASREDMPEMLKRLQERKERHKERHIAYRVGTVIVGVVLVLAGIVLSGPGIPGPGFVVILLGLGLLALEFEPAERLLEKVIIWSDKAKDRVERSSTAREGGGGRDRGDLDRRLRVLGGLLRHPAGAGAVSPHRAAAVDRRAPRRETRPAPDDFLEGRPRFRRRPHLLAASFVAL